MTDYYAVLGVTATADEDVIAAAYRALAKKYHPDTGSHRGTASARKFQEIQEAFDVLGNQSSRTEYDEKRKASDEDPSPSENVIHSKRGSADRHREDPASAIARKKMSTKMAVPTSIAALLIAIVALATSAYSLFSSDQHGAVIMPSDETALVPTITDDHEQNSADTGTNSRNSSTLQKDQKQVDSGIATEQ